MHQIILVLHSLNRFILLALLLTVIVRAFMGWQNKSAFEKTDNKFSLFLFISTHTQLLLGFILYFISPAVFANVKHEMRISQEEIFGPVVSVIKFRDEADALRIANGTAYSLAAGVWSRDIGRVQRFAKKANAGTVWINTYGYTDVRLPWGGVRDSGFGREHGTAAIENFTEPKAIWMNLNV